MIGTIRKHSKWLMVPLFTIVIISFLYFMVSGPSRMGGSAGSTTVDTNAISGEIYGHKVTPEMYTAMSHDVDLYFLFNYGEWPQNNPNVTKDMLLHQIYIRMMLVLKAKELGIHASDDQVQQAAARMLSSPTLVRALGVRSQSVPYDGFVQQVLVPQNLSPADYEDFVRNNLAVEQLQMTFGLPGTLVTPQEAADEYVRQNQEVSAQIVFFSASNFLSGTFITPSDVAMFYTNYMAEYRLPDRVKVNYVEFSVSNYLASAEQELLKSNLDLIVNNYFTQYGMQLAPDQKTPEGAKTEIRANLIRRQAMVEAGQDAGSFVQTVFNVTPVSPQNLATVAHQKNLKVSRLAPFGADYGPQEFAAPQAFTQAAFRLTPDSPISEPVGGPNGVYVIALETNLPSEIPSLDQIRPAVARDLQYREATLMAQRTGTNFTRQLTLQMASGKSFPTASVDLGFVPQDLPPFSLAAQELPELGEHVTLNQFKQVAFGIPMGIPSSFIPTQDGGFVVLVKSQLPVDHAKMVADLPQFAAQFRAQREQQTFEEWMQREGSRELRDTPLAKDMRTAK